MNDATRQTRSADIAALAQATDTSGNVDLTAYQAYRLIYSHSIDGLDAKGVVNDIMRSPAYASEQVTRRLTSLESPSDTRSSRYFCDNHERVHQAGNNLQFLSVYGGSYLVEGSDAIPVPFARGLLILTAKFAMEWPYADVIRPVPDTCTRRYFDWQRVCTDAADRTRREFKHVENCTYGPYHQWAYLL
ncbi:MULTISPECIES: hypothetical protein [Pseudomonas syringae group]|uniref:hypothetical protein n=1 Tax=Pseudomonas syringae group TaxID=136849 RepID=UPI001C312C13|nr:hypothetical protein [Pseudomonas viridiflava]QXG50047.1 hypothetical protein KTT57_13910 [Pseudomonas viridiflava]